MYLSQSIRGEHLQSNRVRAALGTYPTAARHRDYIINAADVGRCLMYILYIHTRLENIHSRTAGETEPEMPADRLRVCLLIV